LSNLLLKKEQQIAKAMVQGKTLIIMNRGFQRNRHAERRRSISDVFFVRLFTSLRVTYDFLGGIMLGVVIIIGVYCLD
jgi:hypothetical protein